MPPPGLHENDAGILDVFQGVFVQYVISPSGGGVGEADRGADRKNEKYASKMRATIYSVLP